MHLDCFSGDFRGLVTEWDAGRGDCVLRICSKEVLYACCFALSVFRGNNGGAQ